MRCVRVDIFAAPYYYWCMDDNTLSRFELIDAELPCKGIRYVICDAYAPDMLPSLAALCMDAECSGAHKVCFSCRDTSAQLPKDGFSAGAYPFAFYSDFFIMEKRIAPLESFTPLRRLTLTPARELLYRELHQAAFFDVPNSRTLSPEDTAHMLSDKNARCGIFMYAGLPAGVYELTLPEQGGVPEITTIGITPEHWGSGLGRAALLTLEQELCAMGYGAITLLVAGANARACRLYARAGYTRKQTVSRWYSAEI